jgi:hypothetical protein
MRAMNFRRRNLINYSFSYVDYDSLILGIWEQCKQVGPGGFIGLVVAA